MKPKSLLAPVLIALAFALAACGSSGDSTSTAGESSATTTEAGGNAPAPSGKAARAAKVKIVEFVYGPDPVTVQVGGKVTWQNEDIAPHTATADDGSFDTGTIEQGKIKSETFKQPGTFTYFCEIHPTMHGTVEVVEKG
ncbi:MAG: plastocyanin [Solirubrobacterales bacterium]|nr:plastocyanin [Solirubrobacterales bacterium]